MFDFDTIQERRTFGHVTDRNRCLNLNVRQVIYSLDWPYSTSRREFLKGDYAKAMDKVLLKAKVAYEAEHT